MTRDDIIRMARDCGWVIYEDMPYMDVQAIQDALIERLERFAALVAAAERKAIEPIVFGLCISDNNAQEIVDAIRKRGQV